MDYPSAKELAKKIIALAESKGVEYNSVEERREGNSRYIDLKVSIKIT